MNATMSPSTKDENVNEEVAEFIRNWERVDPRPEESEYNGISDGKKSSFLHAINPAPPDSILKLAAMYKEDQDPNKVNLGIGAYRDDAGKPFVFDCVKEAEEILARQTKEGKLDKEYLPIDGTPEFQDEARKVLLGDDHPETYLGLTYSAQTLSGTGAVRILAEFLKKYND